jgi:CMP-N,N'-diacetyllegionaminic acid synthase
MKKHKKNLIKKKKIVVLIPARGGSKGIKSKNLYLFGAKPLVAWSIEAAKNEKIVDRVFVSTDDKNISFYSKHYGAEVHTRKKKYSGDKSLVSHTVESFLKYLKLKLKYEPDILVLLEPTSPFREKKLITKCVTKMLKTNSDSIATFKPAKTHPDRCWYINKSGHPIAHSKKEAWKPRQQLKLAYELDGSLYAFKINPKINLRKGLLFDKPTSFVYSGENKVEIDDAKDIQYANYIVENFNDK